MSPRRPSVEDGDWDPPGDHWLPERPGEVPSRPHPVPPPPPSPWVPEDPLPSEPPDDRLVVDLRITEPPFGATFTGPWAGTQVEVRGLAAKRGGAGTLGSVVVQVGSADYQQATTRASGEWEFRATIAADGSYPVKAQARDVSGQVVAERTTLLLVDLDPKPPDPPPPPPPKIAPKVTISSPAPGTFFTLSEDGYADIPLTGSASADPNGQIQQVAVRVDDDVVVGTAQPADGTWSSWTAQPRVFAAGRHTITVTATDDDGQHMSASIEIETGTAPPTPPVVERLLVVEKCELSSYQGAFGAGPTIKTVSLLPGEKTSITVNSYRRDSDTKTGTTSILDSTAAETQDSFETALSSERSNKRSVEQAKSWSVEAEAGVGNAFTWGYAKVKGGFRSDTNAARAETATSTASAVNRQAAEASSKRELEVKTSREMKREEGQDISSQSHIENINLSRTLNFVFSQVVREYVTILHLIDVRVAYVRGDWGEVDERDEKGNVVNDAQGQPRKVAGIVWTYQEASLSQLEPLLRRVLVPERVTEVRDQILSVLGIVFDYQDEPHSLYEVRELHDPETTTPLGSIRRFPRGKTSTYVDASGNDITVPGVILAVTKNVMRTDGVVCDAMLGQGEALDSYSKGLQNAAVEARRAENARQRSLAEKEELAVRLVEQKDGEGAQVFKEVYPMPDDHDLALVTRPASNGSTM